jgi:branched-subunit amino acid aminotransferase/4-amino-4-deoxychorismate lyase
MGDHINYNGQILPSDQPVLKAGSSHLHSCDGVFETMRISNNRILFEDHHFKRLYSGMQFLKFQPPYGFAEGSLRTAILDLCTKNGHFPGARVRLTVFRAIPSDNAGYDKPSFIIESKKLENAYVFNDAGFKVKIYEDARKSLDGLSPFKTTSYTPYALAAIAARQSGFDDCLVLNSAGNICESCISNVFWVKNEMVHTPPYSEGCIWGGMRNYLVNKAEEQGFTVQQGPLTQEMLAEADEVFLTNVIRGIQPVTSFMHVQYRIGVSRMLYQKLLIHLTR